MLLIKGDERDPTKVTVDEVKSWQPDALKGRIQEYKIQDLKKLQQVLELLYNFDISKEERNEKILALMGQVQASTINNSQQNIIAKNDGDIEVDRRHIEELKELYKRLPNGQHIELESGLASDAKEILNRMTIEILEEAHLLDQVDIENLIKLKVDRLTIDVTREQQLKDLIELLRMLENPNDFDCDRAKELIFNVKEFIDAEIRQVEQYGGDEQKIDEVVYVQNIVEKLRSIIILIPDNNEEEISKTNKEKVLTGLKNVMLFLKKDSRDHGQVLLKDVINYKIDRLPLDGKRKEQMKILQQILREINSLDDQDHVRYIEDIRKVIQMLYVDQKALLKAMNEDSSRERAEDEAIAGQIERILEMIPQAMDGHNKDRVKEQLILEIKELMFKIMHDDVSNPRETDIKVMLDIKVDDVPQLTTKKHHYLNNLQHILKMISSNKPMTKKELADLQADVTDRLKNLKDNVLDDANLLYRDHIKNKVESNLESIDEENSIKSGHGAEEEINDLVHKTEQKAADVSRILHEEFCVDEEIDRLKHCLIILPSKAYEPEITTLEKAWLGKELSYLLLDIATGLDDPENVTLENAMKTNTENLKISKGAKRNINCIKDILSGLEKPEQGKKKSFAGKLYSTGTKVLHDIIFDLQDEAKDLFCDDLDDKDQISRVEDLKSEVENTHGDMDKKQENFARAVKNLMQLILEKNEVDKKLKVSDIPRLQIERMGLPDNAAKKLELLKTINSCVLRNQLDCKCITNDKKIKAELTKLNGLILIGARERYYKAFIDEIEERKIQRCLKTIYIELPTKAQLKNMVPETLNKLINRFKELMKEMLSNPDVAQNMSTRDLANFDVETFVH